MSGHFVLNNEFGSRNIVLKLRRLYFFSTKLLNTFSAASQARLVWIISSLSTIELH